jgi:hypothetical protein
MYVVTFLELEAEGRKVNMVSDAADVESPLKPEELQVLRAQYEKEGEYVGLQTKFNYAWVCARPSCSKSCYTHTRASTYSPLDRVL